MIFLQHLILWALPLALLPLVIHLLNRLRYRTVAWGAMAFLRGANRQSTRHARIRQWLLLACRCLAILFLILALSRPLVGGWLGSSMGAPPDTVLILLDRSASMADHLPGTTTTRARHAATQLADATAATDAAAYLLIDGISASPQPLTDPATQLSRPSLSGATDSGTSLPALIEQAIRYLQETPTGTTEIWIATDLQAATWQPDDTRWQELRTRLAALPQPIRVRLLGLAAPSDPNAAIRILQATPRQTGESRALHLVIQLTGDQLIGREVPLRLQLNGVETALTLTPTASPALIQHVVPLTTDTNGWGHIALPADANLRDNHAWFAYPRATDRTTLIAAADTAARQRLQLAAAPFAAGADTVRAIDLATLHPSDLREAALLIFQGATVPEALAEPLRQWIADGGILLAFPHQGQASALLDIAAWGELDTAPAGTPYAVLQPADAAGPLRPAASGEPIPMADLVVRQRRPLRASGDVLASFSDGEPLIIRHTLGAGAILLSATLPANTWSTLGQGPVLVPLVQRLLATGAIRLGDATMETVGRARSESTDTPWFPIAPDEGSQPGTHAGIYRVGTVLTALNRPAAEDHPERLPTDQAHAAFGDLPVHILSTGAGSQPGDQLQSEIWRAFIIIMLIFLAGESFLSLPTRQPVHPAGARA